MSDDTLSTDHALAARLYAQGLAPEECQEMPAHGIPSRWYRLGDTEWQPWCRIEHCWYLVELLGLSIEFLHRHSSWWIGRPSGIGVIVPTFAEIPQGICQVALNVAAGRKG